MAAIARRTWAELRTEVVRRAQGIDATSFSSRVEYALWSAYQDLCLTFHHFELDKVDTSLSLSTSVNSLALPPDCYIVVGVRLRNAAGSAFVRQLSYKSPHVLLNEYRGAPGTPTQYTRFLNTLYFNLLPDTAYHVDLFYYRNPTAPDFSGSATPDTHPEVDEHLIQSALSLLFPALGRPDLAGQHLANLQSWLPMNSRPAIVVETPAGQRERYETPRAIGGAQG